MLVTLDGVPVEFIFTPGAVSDIKGFRELDLDLPRGATILADKAYNDYVFEDLLQQTGGVRLLAKRRSN